MIRKSLATTQAATFAVELPHELRADMHHPVGTGFFVSPEGWFVTAAHVVTDAGGDPKNDIGEALLMKEGRPEHGNLWGRCCRGVSLEFVDLALDFALMKVDFASNSQADWLAGERGFPFLRVATRELEEGEPVYSFGYPLGESTVHRHDASVTVATQELCPRVTSAIVSSTLERHAAVRSTVDPVRYVVDKALNYGNSGGPIVATETGKVHAFCSRFQPVEIPQAHLGQGIRIVIPSLYGVVISLSNRSVVEAFKSRGVPLE